MTEPSDQAIFEHYHDVRIDHDNIAHYRGMLAGKLLINRCDGCGHWIYPHRSMCPECFCWEVTATEVSGRGKLHMYAFLNQSRDPDKPLSEPLQVAAIELAEQAGLRYLSRIIDCPADRLHHDMPVALVWIEENGRQWPAFKAVEG